MKVISDKDLLYNPIEIKKTFRKPQNLDIANFEQQFKNLTDYYTRFKKIETTWINEFNTLIINKNNKIVFYNYIYYF